MLWLILLGLVTYFCFFHLYWKRRNLPPGPTPLPLVGNLLELDPANPQNSLFKWGQKYGPIYTVWIGPDPIVMVNDFGAMKQYFTGKTADTFAYRMDQFIFQDFRNGKFGVVMTDGALWKEQRRFALHVLRDFGFGRNLMELKIQESVQDLLHNVRRLIGEQQQKTISLDHALNLCVGNVINRVMFGRAFVWQDPRFLELKTLMDELLAMTATFKLRLLDQVPWLRFLPILGHFGFDEYLGRKRRFWELMEEEIAQNRESFDADAEPSDFVTAYYREMEERKKKKEGLGFFSQQQLVVVVMDIWFAGQETTVTTLKWALLLMVRHPDIQAKVQQEIDQFYGTGDVTVSMKDKQDLPFTAATIQEAQRLANLLPVNIPHTIGQEVEILGYKLPKGTSVTPQMSTVFIDPTVFPNPEQMDPTRFLDGEGKLKKVEEFIPFSLGKRVCLGESLAKVELFLIFTALLRHFEFGAVPGEPLPTLEPEIAFVRRPKEFKVLIGKRHG